MTERHPPAIPERTFQRRRLAVLGGVLALVLAAAPFLEQVRAGGDAPVQVAAAEPAPATVRIASAGSPTAVRELLSQTTTTLVEATGSWTTTTTAPPAAPTSTTAAPTTTTTTAPPAPSTTAAAPTTTSSTTTRPPATTAPPTTSAPPTTAAPRTTTTTAPARQGYAYDDPRSTQVWYDLAGCESGGNWSINTGNGYYGGLQFSLPTWESVGGTGYPHEHPAATQIELGRKLQARQGWGAWPHCSEKLGLR